MSTQRVLLMLFVTVAVAWMVGYAEGKHAADRWWQADEAKKIQTVWGIAGQSIWDNAAQCSTGCSSILGSYGTIPCGKDSVFMYPCPAKKVQAQIPCPKEKPKQ